MAYKVLNLEGERIIVDSIDPQIHKHLSGRDFTEDDACVKTLKPKNLGEKEIKENIEAIAEHNNIEVEVVEELTRETAVELYKEKFGRKPSSMMKLENIIVKLQD